MSDIALINFLIAKTGSPTDACRELGGMKTQRLFNWRSRGIPFRERPAFFVVVNRFGAGLPESWLFKTKRGNSNGRASKKQRVEKAEAKGGKGKRSRSQQRARPARRRATGRGEAAVAG
jgi:hypothetical protein